MILSMEKYHSGTVGRYCGVTKATAKKWFETGKIESEDGWTTSEEFMRFLDSHPRYKERVEKLYKQELSNRRNKLFRQISELEIQKELIMSKIEELNREGKIAF